MPLAIRLVIYGALMAAALAESKSLTLFVVVVLAAALVELQHHVNQAVVRQLEELVALNGVQARKNGESIKAIIEHVGALREAVLKCFDRRKE